MTYDFATLERLLTDPTRDQPTCSLAESLGINHRQVFKLRETGLTTAKADQLAIAAGFHPWQVWTSWFSDAADEPMCPECNEPAPFGSIYCSKFCGDTHRRKRKRTTYAAKKRTPTPCGTDAGHSAHRRAGELPCDACRTAKSEADRARQRRRLEIA